MGTRPSPLLNSPMQCEIAGDSPEQIANMEDATAANSGSSPESPNETTDMASANLITHPEISSPTASTNTRRREPLDPVRTKRNALVLLSLLVVLFTMATEWRYLDRPLPVAPVWHLSLLFSLLCLPWIAFLTVTPRTRTAFLHLYHGVLLSVVAHLALSPKVGMLAVHLNSHVAVGFLGYALAERRLHESTAERFDIPMATTKEQAERMRGLRILTGLCIGAATMGVAVRVAWVVRHADEYPTSELLINILGLIPGTLTLWISFVAALLRGALMEKDSLALVASYFGPVAFVVVLSALTMGDAAAAINGWITVLGMSGFFGYSLCVYDSYKGMIREKEEPLLKEEASSSAADESANLVQPTTDKSDGSRDDETES